MLSVTDLTVLDPDNPERAVVNGLDLHVRAGEIVCIYGLMGAGRTELLEAVAGRGRVESGEIDLEGESILRDSISERIERASAWCRRIVSAMASSRPSPWGAT